MPGASAMRENYLVKEFIRVEALDRAAVCKAIAITIMSDGWTDAQGRSIVATIAVTERGEVFIIDIRDCSATSHTGEFMADVFAEAIQRVGATRVLAICTDGASNMCKGRALLTQRPGFKHIIDLRCQMHGFALLLASAFAEPNPKKPRLGWWEAIGKQIMWIAQHIINFFNASHIPRELLRVKAKALGCPITVLKTSNKTRFTSCVDAIDSVVLLEVPMQTVYEGNKSLFKKKPVIMAVLGNRGHFFWRRAPALLRVLRPLTQVIGAVQAETCTPADITRYWLHLCRHMVPQLTTAKEELGGSFIGYLSDQFLKRMEELNLPIFRLALFLNPHRKAAAGGAGNIMRNYGFKSQAATMRLYAQLHAYRFDTGIFATSMVVGPNMGSRESQVAWWEGIARLEGGDVIAKLAIILLRVVPQSAACERLFSSLQWQQSKRRNRMAVATLSAVAGIRSHHQRQGAPKLAK
ncbi:unnamed protein product, partial [Phaeothamnion confervicola]